MRRGYLRLQAVIKSRELRKTFINLRKFFVNLQAIGKGYLVRMLIKEKGHIIKAKLDEFRKEKAAALKAGKSETQASDEYEKKFTEVMRSIWFIKEVPVENNVRNTAIDDRYVDDVFGFLKDTTTPAGTVRGTGFGVVCIIF